MAGVSVVVSGGETIVAGVDGKESIALSISNATSLSPILVSVGNETAVSPVAVSQSLVNVSVDTSSSPSPMAVSIGGGIGPAAVVNTAGVVVGVNPVSLYGGDNITVSGSSAAYTIIGPSDQYISSKAPVQNIQGRTGSVVLVAGDITAGTFDVARIPVLPSQGQVISTGSLSSVSPAQQQDVVKGTIVTTVDGKRWVYKGDGLKTIESSYIELSDTTPEWSVIANKPATFTPGAHSHATGDITGIESYVKSFGNVVSVQGRTGNVIITRADITAAASAHTHNASDVSGGVVSVQGRTGNVIITRADITAAASTHAHNYVRSLSTVTGDVSISGGQGITVTTSEASIVITAGESGLQWKPVPTSPFSLIGDIGDIARDDEYLYVSVGGGYVKTWKRTPLSTWSPPADPSFSFVELLLHLDGAYASPATPVDTSSHERAVNVVGVVQQYPGPTTEYPGSGFFGGAVYFSDAYLGYLSIDAPGSSGWDISGDSLAIEFFLNLQVLPATRTKILGADLWGIFITPQSEEDYGTSHRLETIRFVEVDGDLEIDSRFDSGPIQAGVWTYVLRGKNVSYSGTQAGQPASWTSSFYPVGGSSGLGYMSWAGNGSGDKLTIGGDSTGSIYGYIDEVRITKGASREPFFATPIVPVAPFSDA